MKEKISQVSSYGVFLETLENAMKKSKKDPFPEEVLVVLYKQKSAIGMKTLLAAVQLSPTELVKAIEAMKKQDLVTVATISGDDLVELTPTGSAVARLKLGKD